MAVARAFVLVVTALATWLASTPAAAETTAQQAAAAQAQALAAAPHRPTLRASFERMNGQAGDSKALVLDDNAAAWAARWDALAKTQRSIDASYFILRRDVFGLAFIANLYMHAREGVQVSLLLDGRGSVAVALPFLGLDELQELVATGNADVRIYNPPVIQIARTIVEMSAVPVSAGTHNKILIIDDDVAITGGRNMASIYFARPGEVQGAVVDSDVLFQGGAPVDALDEVVEHEIAQWGEERVRRDAVNLDERGAMLRMIYFAMDAWLRTPPPATGNASDDATALEAMALAHFDVLPPAPVRDEVRPLLLELAGVRSVRGALAPATATAVSATSTTPTTTLEAKVVPAFGRAESWDDSANDAIMSAISSARKRVWIQSPYFMLTPRLLNALEHASERGVEIVVLTNGPGSSDNDPSQALFIDTWPELEARMPTLRVLVATQQMTHVKRVIVDDELVLMGSHNLDPLSAHLNSEVVVALWSRAMNASASARFQAIETSGAMLEYRIKRFADGRPIRDRAGHLRIAFGPENHVTQKRLSDLRSLKDFLFSVRGIYDFEFVAW